MSDFVPCCNSLVEGIGLLAPSRYEALNNCRCKVSDRVRAYMKVIDSEQSKTLVWNSLQIIIQNLLYTMLQNLLHIMYHSCICISFLHTTFLEMTFGITEFQRYFLEVLGLIDFLKIYEPRMQGCAPRAMSAADCLGAFTNNPQFAQQLFNAGLLVYFIRQLDPFYADDPVIQTKTSPHFEHYALPDPALFVMLGDDKKKLAYLLTWLRTRPALLYYLQKQDSTALSNQAWRDFLEMGCSDKLKNDSAAAMR